jgi:hypothetical protein
MDDILDKTIVFFFKAMKIEVSESVPKELLLIEKKNFEKN